MCVNYYSKNFPKFCSLALEHCTWSDKATIINIVSQAIAHANFHPHVNFLIMGTELFFPQACTFTSVASVSCRLLLWSGCSIQSLVVPTGRRVLLVINLQPSLAHESACNHWKSSHNRSKAVLVLSFLKTYHNIFWGCFGVFRHSFQARYLANWRLFQTVYEPDPSVFAAAAAPIGYRIWVLEAISAAVHESAM